MHGAWRYQRVANETDEKKNVRNIEVDMMPKTCAKDWLN